MDSILFHNSSIHEKQPSLSFNPDDSLFPTYEEGHTTLTQIQFSLDDDDDDVEQIQPSELVLEEGEIDRRQLRFEKPLFPTIPVNDPFYEKFYNEAEVIPGSVRTKYSVLQKRLGKFFIQREEIQRGERVNQKIEADYSNPSTYPLNYAIMIYGIDYLSNRDMRKYFNLPKDSRHIKRINWSNAAIIFDSRSQMEQCLRPLIWDKDTNDKKHSFFEPKQEEDAEEMSVPKKLPRGWYGLKPYEHKEQWIFWFVRYLTSEEPDHLNEMTESINFMEHYNTARKLWTKKFKERQEFYHSALNSSRYETIDRSRKDRSICLGSEPGKRERSRERSRGAASQNFGKSAALFDLESNESIHEAAKKHPDLNESYVEPMSFIYTPNMDMQVEAELKKRSDEIVMLMEEIHLGGTNTLGSMRSGSIFDDDDMAIMSQNFDPKGLDQRFLFNRSNKIAELTALRADEKFNYRQYTEKILEAQQENREKKIIPVIFID